MTRREVIPVQAKLNVRAETKEAIERIYNARLAEFNKAFDEYLEKREAFLLAERLLALAEVE